MTDANTTIRKLAEITDAAAFERLATAVLRSANAALYGSLSHSGVNAEGKTVKAPLDNIGWVTTSGEERIVAAAHSTCKVDDIANKWLHDPATVKPRKSGAKPTAPDGDLIKAIREFSAFRVDRPGLCASLALTSNREPDQSSIVAAHKLAADAYVDLEIWSGSRIAQHLDSTPEGQIIRGHFLGAPIELVSKSVLQEIGRASLSEYSRAQAGELVDRIPKAIRGAGHTLLVGSSGVGKTTIAMQMLQVHLDQGGIGLVIPDETLEVATSIAEAIDIVIRKAEPYIEPQSGLRALEFATDQAPLMVIVEDLNRANNPSKLLNKALSWTARQASEKGANTKWRLVCPLWPRYVDSIEQKAEQAKHVSTHMLDVYTDAEAFDAIHRRAVAAGTKLLPAKAAEIAKSLGNDPLLIAVHNFDREATAVDGVEKYIDEEFTKVASATLDLVRTDFDVAADLLVRQMLACKNLSPSMADIKLWFKGDQEHLKALRILFGSGTVLRLASRGRSDVLEARHDRILLSLMSRVVRADLEAGQFGAEYIADPFFGEAVGVAALRAGFEPTMLKHLVDANPISLFYAFRTAVRTGAERTELVKTMGDWLSEDKTCGVSRDSVRYHAAMLLAECDAKEVLMLTGISHKRDWTSFPWLRARFRNGDIGAGLKLFVRRNLGTKIPGQRELIEHVIARFGRQACIDTLYRIVESEPQLTYDKIGILRLAGFFGGGSLEQIVRRYWNGAERNEIDLAEFLWPAIRCYDGAVDSPLGSICDAWAELPVALKDDDGNRSSPRDEVAAYTVTWLLRDYPAGAALPFLISRAQNDDRLTWQITYMLRGVDHPTVLEYLTRYLVGKNFFHQTTIADEWRRKQEDGLEMSPESKTQLLKLALDECNDLDLRKSAFRLWELAMSPSDLQEMKSITRDGGLYEQAVWGRARRADRSVIPELIEMIPNNPRYWWHAGQWLWSDDLTKALQLGIHEGYFKLGTDSNEDEINCDSELAERLMELATVTAEKILLDEWEKIKGSVYYVQAALYHCTPGLTALAKAAIHASPEPGKIFTHITMSMGCGMQGRKGIRRIEQANLLMEFAEYLSEHDLHELWTLYSENGWEHSNKTILQKKLTDGGSWSAHVNPRPDLSFLDKALSGGRMARNPFWVEHQTNRGVATHTAIDALFEWLRNQDSVSALAIACGILKISGSRVDLSRLQALVAAWDGCSDLDMMEDLNYSVRRRTLV